MKCSTSRSPSVHTGATFLHDGQRAGRLSCRLLPFRAVFSSRPISHRPSRLGSHSLSLSLSLFAWLFVCFDTQKPHLPSVCHPTLLLSFMCRIHSFIFFFSFCLCDQTCQLWHLIFFKNAFIWKTDTKAARRRVRVGVNH